jgi:tetratricopeptide (TPR) repeat protein
VASLSRTRIRTYALFIGVALIVVLAIPARNRLSLTFALQRAQTAIRDQEFDEAIEVLDALNRTHPGRSDVCYLLGVTYRRVGQFDQSFEYLQQAEELGWPLSDVTRQRYLARFQAGEIEATQGYLYTLLQGGADDVVATEIYETLAQGYLKEARIVDSIVVLDHWIEWQPQAVHPRFWRAQLQETFEEDWGAAAENYGKILEIDPSHIEARLGLANALFKSQKVEEAQKEYLNIRERLPENALAMLGLARCQQRLGKSSDAVELYEVVTTADIEGRHRAEAWTALGQIALANSDDERAVECFESALQENPRQVQTHHLLGTIYSRLGQEEKAQQHIKRSQDVLASNQRMSALADEITKEPQNLAPRMEMAKLLTESGDTQAAIRWLQTVIHIDPRHADARQALAKLFTELGVHDVAAKHREYARRAGQISASAPATE